MGASRRLTDSVGVSNHIWTDAASVHVFPVNVRDISAPQIAGERCCLYKIKKKVFKKSNWGGVQDQAAACKFGLCACLRARRPVCKSESEQAGHGVQCDRLTEHCQVHPLHNLCVNKLQPLVPAGCKAQQQVSCLHVQVEVLQSGSTAYRHRSKKHPSLVGISSSEALLALHTQVCLATGTTCHSYNHHERNPSLLTISPVCGDCYGGLHGAIEHVTVNLGAISISLDVLIGVALSMLHAGAVEHG